MFMKRNFLQQLVDCIGKISQNHNFFDRIFITVLLVEILNFISYENNTTSDVILQITFQKSFTNLTQ